VYKVQQGAIKIGGINLKYISDQSLRELISVVPQQVELFSGTLADNIALGEQEADLGSILEIVSLLEMEDFIENLDNGLHTFIGESGSNLSGGQKQRIAIARALYRDPQILLMDEPTSSLDKHSEEAMIRAIKEQKRKRKTVIIVSHRASTISEADSVLVIDGGKLIRSDIEIEQSGLRRHLESENHLNQGL